MAKKDEATTPQSSASSRRRRKAKPSATEGASGGTSALTCPECGRTFARGAALGAHRSRAHGVAGTSRRRRSSRAPRAPRAPRAAAATTRRATGNGASRPIDRDALLRTLFPNGVPARGEALQAASAWLDEAERLAAMR